MARPTAGSTGVRERATVVVILVRPGAATARRVAMLLRWVRFLVPAALLVVSQVPLGPSGRTAQVITLNADATEWSPLAVAHAILEARLP